jgi:hypothetical protein
VRYGLKNITHVCMPVRVYACTCVCVYACTCVCVYVSMRVRVYACMRVRDSLYDVLTVLTHLHVHWLLIRLITAHPIIPSSDHPIILSSYHPIIDHPIILSSYHSVHSIAVYIAAHSKHHILCHITSQQHICTLHPIVRITPHAVRKHCCSMSVCVVS